MQRRQFLQHLAVLGAGTLMGSVARSALAGAPLHTPPAALVFNATQRSLVARLAERIIPATDTPGAIAAGVPAFVERMVSEWYNTTERGLFLTGLADCEGYCREQFGIRAHRCSDAQLDIALKHFETLASTYRSPIPEMAASLGIVDSDAPFFIKLKELTVLGYYTSEIGATQELRYDPMPMTYTDVVSGPDDRAWSAGGLLR